jgi:phosphoglycolate phosphatase-like HAD superfamily hydrolase
VAPTSAAFDLDGTLIDAQTRQVAVAANALERLRAPELDQTRFWRRKRAGANTVDALLGMGYPADVAREAARLWGEQIEDDEWLALDGALTDAQRVLARVRAAGKRAVVITARRREAGARFSVSAAGLDDLVDELIVVAPDDAVLAKARALSHYGASWFVGDTASDGHAAGVAGVPFAAVSTGQRSPSALRKQGFESRRSLSSAVRWLSGVSGSAPLVRK